ncbi:hypothetical protein IEQ34_012967 [Dendrobium chrysotoxum]|uniref:Citrate transporter-like domain-containing protein n=1 Tax=Dendrobium chrysotoxum TaxID=161865 RepID=A0AAV7GQ14_DENCH|nr:hypothetical protein IEQ34_012967 [Dendrobium chrysotoxum]
MASSCSFGSQLLPRSLSHRTPAAATYAPSSLGIARFRLQIYPRFRPLPAFSLCFQRWQRSGVIVRAEEEARDSSPPQRGKAAGGSDGIGEYKELMNRSGVCDPLCSVDEVSSQDFKANYQPKTDLLKALTILISALAGAAAINHSWVAENQDAAMALVFVLGYAGIIFEESLAFNKSGVGLLMAVCLWVIRSIGAPSTDIAITELTRASAEVGEIVFFLLGAMTIVEIIDAHQGFKLVTDNITTRKPRVLLWVVGFVTFFLSSVLDNLTSTIVMVSLLRKLVPPSEYRRVVHSLVHYCCLEQASVYAIKGRIDGALNSFDTLPNFIGKLFDFSLLPLSAKSHKLSSISLHSDPLASFGPGRERERERGSRSFSPTSPSDIVGCELPSNPDSISFGDLLCGRIESNNILIGTDDGTRSMWSNFLLIRRFFGSFVAERLRPFDGFPFRSDRAENEIEEKDFSCLNPRANTVVAAVTDTAQV